MFWYSRVYSFANHSNERIIAHFLWYLAQEWMSNSIFCHCLTSSSQVEINVCILFVVCTSNMYVWVTQFAQVLSYLASPCYFTYSRTANSNIQPGLCCLDLWFHCVYSPRTLCCRNKRKLVKQTGLFCLTLHCCNKTSWPGHSRQMLAFSHISILPLPSVWTCFVRGAEN